MEDENGLDLSLGLSCGGSLSKSKVKDASSDSRSDEGSASSLTGSKLVILDGSFENLSKAGLENQDPKGKQKRDLVTHPQENFFTDLAKYSSPIANCSYDARTNLSWYQGMWISSNQYNETEEEKSGSIKRKLPFEELNCQTKNEKLSDFVDKHGKNSTRAPSVRNSNVSITVGHDSTGENGDAEVKVEGHKSWLVSQREENVNCSGTLKFNSKNILRQPSGIGSQGQKEPCLSANTDDKPLVFVHSSVQFPALDIGSSWAFNSHPLHVSSFTSREQSDGVQNQEYFKNGSSPHNASGAFLYDTKSSDLVIDTAKYVGATVVSAPSGDEIKSRNSAQVNEVKNKPTMEGYLHEGSDIRPGISSNLKFGGSGSYPDLPWVSIMGPGPNGKTISGVTYKYNQNQTKVVCACHGAHMSPEEFVQHASCDGLGTGNDPNLASFPSSNTANSNLC